MSSLPRAHNATMSIFPSPPRRIRLPLCTRTILFLPCLSLGGRRRSRARVFFARRSYAGSAPRLPPFAGLAPRRAWEGGEGGECASSALPQRWGGEGALQKGAGRAGICLPCPRSVSLSAASLARGWGGGGVELPRQPLCRKVGCAGLAGASLWLEGGPGGRDGGAAAGLLSHGLDHGTAWWIIKICKTALRRGAPLPFGRWHLF